LRLKLSLSTLQNSTLSVNFNYALSAAIYKYLHFSSPEFSSFLHNKGYVTNGKSYKLFSFALRFNDFTISNNKIFINNSKAELFITSPIVDDFIKNFILSSFNKGEFEIFAEGINTKFFIELMEAIPDKDFNKKEKFKLLSPLVLSTVKEFEGKQSQYYLRYYDDINIIERVFNQNLFNKYKLIFNKEYKDEPLKFEWDTNFINKRISHKKRITKKITIPKPKNIRINLIGNVAPFYLSGNPELIKIGYDCGFGQNNSLGFGMAEVIN